MMNFDYGYSNDSFNEDVLIRQIRAVCKNGNVNGSMIYPLDSYVDVFMYFIQKYRRVKGYPHPRMTKETIKWICSNLWTDLEGNDYLPEQYPELIDRFFDTKFADGCNYSMRFFMSGKIRHNRLQEIILSQNRRKPNVAKLTTEWQ